MLVNKPYLGETNEFPPCFLEGPWEQRCGNGDLGFSPSVAPVGVCVCAELLRSCLTLQDSMDASPPGPSVCGGAPGKNTGVGCRALLQGIFLTQRLNPHLPWLLRWQADS